MRRDNGTLRAQAPLHFFIGRLERFAWPEVDAQVMQRTGRSAMTSANPCSPRALQLVGELKNAIAEVHGIGLGTLTHRFPVSGPDGRLAVTYTVDVTRDYDGVYLATCREVVSVFTTADSEDEALSLVRLAILASLIRSKRLPPSPA